MQGPMIVLIFCSILFLYVHIYFHLKTSDDLEVYEIDKPSKDKLEEICDLRQPVVFNFQNEEFIHGCCLENLPLTIMHLILRFAIRQTLITK